jgi:formylmethanofuran dehydrogenase subunit C
MSGLTFRLTSAPVERLDLSRLTPKHLATTPLAEVLRLDIGTTKSGLKVGDAFAVSGKPGTTVTIEGSTSKLDFIGAYLEDGDKMIVEGDAGVGAGRSMRGGRLEIRGDASALLGTGLSGGEIFVKGSAAGQVGGLTPGDKFGMTGGLIVIDGHAGDRVGDRMRRGTIYIRGKCGSFAGSRMVGGTIWTELGFGADPGLLLRRGTLIGPSVEQLLPTFADAGRHDLVILPILSRYLKAKLGASAPKPLPSIVRKYTGDLATIGKGEILITA